MSDSDRRGESGTSITGDAPLAHLPELHTLENRSLTLLDVRPELFRVRHGAPGRSMWQMSLEALDGGKPANSGEELQHWYAAIRPSPTDAVPAAALTAACSLKLIGWRHTNADLSQYAYDGPLLTVRPVGGLDAGPAVQVRARHPNAERVSGGMNPHPDTWFLSLHVVDTVAGGGSQRRWVPSPATGQEGRAEASEVEVAAGTWHRVAVVVAPAAVVLFVDGVQSLAVGLEDLRSPSFASGVETTFGPPASPNAPSGAGPQFGFWWNAYEDTIGPNFKVADARLWSLALDPGHLVDDARRAEASPAEQQSVEISGAAPKEYDPNSTLSGVQASWALLADPSLYLIETYRLTVVPAAVGFGRVAKTLALLPGERTTTYVSTTRRVKKTSDTRQTILDSTSERLEDTFGEQVSAERQRRDLAEQSASSSSKTAYQVSAKASAKWGWGSASVSASVSGEQTTSRAASSVREELASSLRAVTAASAREANSQRDIEVVAQKTEEEEETHIESIERTFENPHASRTMMATFRQMNQRYVSLLTLVEVEIGYQEFRSSLDRLDELLQDVLVDEFPRSWKARGRGTPASVVRDYILTEYDEAHLPAPAAETVDGVVAFEHVGGAFLRQLEAGAGTGAGSDGGPSVNRERQTVVTLETGGHVKVDGALVAADSYVLRTDNVGAECVLGGTEVFDPFERESRDARLRELEIANDLRAERVSVARQLAATLNEGPLSDGSAALLRDLLCNDDEDAAG